MATESWLTGLALAFVGLVLALNALASALSVTSLDPGNTKQSSNGHVKKLYEVTIEYYTPAPCIKVPNVRASDHICIWRVSMCMTVPNALISQSSSRTCKSPVK